MKKLIKNLIEQIEMANFKDENGMSLKNNKAYAELKEATEKPNSPKDVYLLISNLMGSKREDWIETNDSIEFMAECVAKAQEENEFMVFMTVNGNKIAVRANDIESISEPRPE